MKKLFNILLLSVAAVSFFSCDSAEQEFKFDYYYENIYTVNKHKVQAEFSDSLIAVANMDESMARYGFESGDRARMVLRYYYNANTMKVPQWSIAEFYEVIPTLPLSASVDTALYNTPFNMLHMIDFMDRYANPVWTWKNRQNINISYFGAENDASFAMTVAGVDGEYIDLNLYAKAKRVGNATCVELLTFDMSDLSMLSDEQRASVAGMDSLKTRISFSRELNGKVEKATILGGKVANPYK